MKNYVFLKKMVMVMKGLSTAVACFGAICLIFFITYYALGYQYMNMTLGQMVVVSLVILVLGVMGEDLFDNLVYNLEAKNLIY